MRKLTRQLWWALYWLLVAVVTLLAACVVVLRLLLPGIGAYQPQLERWLSSQLQAQVQITQLEGLWQQGFPTLRVKGLTIEQPERLQFSLQHADVALNLKQSFLQFRPVFSRLQFTRPDVKLRLSATQAAKSTDASTLPDDSAVEVDFSAFVPPLWVLDQPLDIEQGRVHVVQPEGFSVQLRNITAGLVAVGRTWQLNLSAQLGDGDEFRPLRTVVEGQGAPQRGTVWFYSEFDGLASTLLNQFLPDDVQLKSTNLRQQFWARVQQGRIKLVQSRTALHAVHLAEHWQLDDSQVVFDLQPGDQGYQLQLYDSALSLNGQPLSLPVIAANIERFEKRWWVNRLQIPDLPLAPISQFLAKQPLPDEVLEIVNSLNLRGDISHVNAHWHSPKWSDVSLAADLNQLAMDAWDDVPQILGIDGRLEASPRGGSIHLNSQDFTLNFPTLFPEAWRYEQADGVVGWSLTDNAAIIHSELLHLKQAEIEAHGRFSLRLPFDGGQTDLTLMIGTKGADGRVASRYVPPEEIGEQTYAWLKRAIHAGHVKQGGFLLSGGTRSRLDDYQLPAVQMFFDIEGAEFEFEQGWPLIRQGDAFMLYKDGALSVDVTSGRLFDSNIQRAWVGLHPDGSRLDIVGTLKGDAADVRTLLLDSPLREEVGDELENWQLTGDLDTALQVRLPLESGTPDIDIRSQLQRVRLYSPGYALDFTDIEGELVYQTPYGLAAEKLTTQFMGQQGEIRIESAPLAEDAPLSESTSPENVAEQPEVTPSGIIRTQIQLDSRMKMSVLRDWMRLPFLNIADGETWYRARLNLCQGASAGCSGLDVRSSLQGIEVVGPAVLAKARDEQRYFQLNSDLQRPAEQVSLRYGDDVYARLQLVDQQFERGRVAFNRTPVTLPPDPGLRVIGSVPELKFDRLMQLVERAGLLQADGAAAPVGERSKMLHSIALNVERFELESVSIDNLDAVVKPDSRGWLLDVASETVTGSVQFPANGGPYQVSLAGLNLTGDDQPPQPLAQATLASGDVQPDALPHADVFIQQLTLDGKPMGGWSFALLPDDQGVTLQDIQGKLVDVAIQGNIRWDAGQRQQSAMTLKFEGGDVGEVMQLWQQGRPLENQELKSYLQLTWPGAPWQFRIGHANGEANFLIKQGRLRDTGAGSNFLRLFGILNLNTLSRRLRLDFSDLFEEGVAFDRIEGNYVLKNGVAQSQKTFTLQGPSVDMKLDGQLDLENETLNQQMTVTLPVTSNLPIMGVLLGAAPPVAGAAFLLDKLIGDELQNFTSLRYRITGRWDDPQLTLPQGAQRAENEIRGTQK